MTYHCFYFMSTFSHIVMYSIKIVGARQSIDFSLLFYLRATCCPSLPYCNITV
jgi:hypothetical protein